MGDRGQVHIIGREWKGKSSHVWLYTHWGCEGLISDVWDALKKARGKEQQYGFGTSLSGRWDDDEYLVRIIFQQMIKYKDGYDEGLTGYGIAGGENRRHGDVYRVVTVDVRDQTVLVYTDSKYEKTKTRFSGSFQEFVDTPDGSIMWYDPEE